MLHSENQTLIHKLLHDSMSKIYVFQAFLTFIKSLIGIFAPVYVYSLGYSITQVILFIMGISFTYLLFIPITTKIINKIGFKYSILLSVPIYISHIACLNYLQTNPNLFILTWLTYGIHMAIFWPAMHSEIAINSDKKKSANQIGTLQILITLVSAMAPLIGGYYLEFLEFYHLLIISTIITIIGSIPLIFSKDIKIQNHNYNYSTYIKFLKTPKFKKSFQAFFAEGIEGFLNLSFWPVLLFIILNGSFLKLGTVFTAVSFVSILIMGYFKSYIDSHPKKNILNKTIRFKSIGWFLRIILLSFSGALVYIVESIRKLNDSIFGITFMSIFYNNAKNINPMDYVILREMGIHGAKISFGILLIILIQFFGEIKEIFIISLLIGMIANFWLGKLHEEI